MTIDLNEFVPMREGEPTPEVDHSDNKALYEAYSKIHTKPYEYWEWGYDKMPDNQPWNQCYQPPAWSKTMRYRLKKDAPTIGDLKHESFIRDLSYMTHSSLADKTGKYVHAKIVELSGDTYWGFTIGNKVYASIHVWYGEMPRVMSDDTEKEERQIHEEGKVHLILFRGSDNTSFMKRFVNEVGVINYIRDLEKFDIREDPELLFYNS